MLGQEACAGIEFVCSDMWRPYIRVIRERCSQAVHILDRFHIVANMNDALDDVRAEEARALARHGREPVLKKSRWCLLKRSENLTTPQKGRLKELLRYNTQKCPRLSVEGRLPAVLGVRLADLGRQVLGRLVHNRIAFVHRAHEEDRAHVSTSPTAHLELV